MKQSHPLILILALGMLAGSALAKGKKDEGSTSTYGCAKFDTNQNGVLDPEEADALRKAFSEGDTALKPLDLPNDGKLDDSELARIKLPKPAKEKNQKKKKDA